MADLIKHYHKGKGIKYIFFFCFFFLLSCSEESNRITIEELNMEISIPEKHGYIVEEKYSITVFGLVKNKYSNNIGICYNYNSIYVTSLPPNILKGKKYELAKKITFQSDKNELYECYKKEFESRCVNSQLKFNNQEFDTEYCRFYSDGFSFCSNKYFFLRDSTLINISVNYDNDIDKKILMSALRSISFDGKKAEITDWGFRQDYNSNPYFIFKDGNKKMTIIDTVKNEPYFKIEHFYLNGQTKLLAYALGNEIDSTYKEYYDNGVLKELTFYSGGINKGDYYSFSKPFTKFHYKEGGIDSSFFEIEDSLNEDNPVEMFITEDTIIEGPVNFELYLGKYQGMIKFVYLPEDTSISLEAINLDKIPKKIMELHQDIMDVLYIMDGATSTKIPE